MQRDWLATGFLFLTLGALLYLLGALLLPYAAPVAWAIILALVFHPAHRLLLRVLPRYPNLAAALSTLAVLGIAVVPSLVLSGVVAREAVEGYQRLVAYVRSNPVDLLKGVADHWAVAPLWDWARERMSERDTDPTTFLLSGLRWVSNFVASRAAAVARNVFAFFVGVGIMTFSLFFVLRDGREMLTWTVELLPLPRADRERLVDRIGDTVLAVVRGLSLTALVQGLLVGSGLWLVGMPFALLLSAAAFLLSFLPVGGAALVWLPVVVGLAVGGHYGSAVFLAVWGVLLVSSVDNFLRPILIGSQADLSTPVLFFGILGGLNAFGFLGLFLGPTILAAFASLLSMYRERFLAPG